MDTTQHQSKWVQPSTEHRVWIQDTIGHRAVPENYPTYGGVVRYDGEWQVTSDVLFLLFLVSSLLLLLEVRLLVRNC